MIRIPVSPTAPEADAIERAVAVLRRGGVAAIPTDTLYGLAADPFSRAAVGRIFAIKGRDAQQALPLVAADEPQVEQTLGSLGPLGTRLAELFWPGALTLVIPAPQSLAPEVLGGGTTVAVRVPAHAVTRALCARFGRPLTATSANATGASPTNDPELVWSTLGSAVDALVDSGPTPGLHASTIVDVTIPVPHLVREGAIAWDVVQSALSRR